MPSPPSIVARIGSSSAGIVGRTRLVPETGEVGRGARFEHARFLAAGNLDGLEKTCFRSRVVAFRSLQCDPAGNPMQLGKPHALAGLFNIAMGLLQRTFRPCDVARH
jgi:hypothetical protein